MCVCGFREAGGCQRGTISECCCDKRQLIAAELQTDRQTDRERERQACHTSYH